MRHVIDGRDMVPPEPLEATLSALETMADGDEVLLLLYRQPHPLYGILRNEGMAWTESLRDDGTCEILIRRA